MTNYSFRALLLFALLLGFLNSNAQSTWNLIFDSISIYPTGSVMEGVQTSDGGFVVAGTKSEPMDPERGFILKLDANGNLLWYKEYEDIVELFSAIETSDGGLLLGGMSATVYPGHYIFLKTDANGDFLWAHKVLTPIYDGVQSLFETANGFVFGSDQIGKLSLDGDSVLWRSRIFSGNGTAAAVAPAPGGYLAVGTGNNLLPSAGLNLGVIRVDLNGNVLWNKAIGGGDTDFGQACAATQDGGVMVAGWTRSFVAGGVILGFMSKLDSAGSLLWTKTYGNANSSSFIHDIMEMPNGDFMVTGAYEDSLMLMRTDAAGNPLWAKNYGGGYGQSLEQTSDGGFFISAHERWYDMVLLKTDSLGNSDCSTNISVLSQNETFQIVDNVLVTFGPQVTLTETVAPTLSSHSPRACNAPLSISSPVSTSPRIRIFPNPISPGEQLHLEWDFELAETGALEIVDANGRRLFSQSLELQGPHKRVEIPIHGFPKGIYLLNLYSEGKIHSRKFILR